METSRLPSVRRPAGSVSKIRPVSMIEGSMLPNLANTSAGASEVDTSKKIKRRSLLPQFSSKVSGDENAGVGIKEEDEEVAGNESRAASEETRDSAESLRRKKIDEERQAMPPPASGLSRPMSMIPPRGSSQASRKQLKQSHARDESRAQNVDAQAARSQSLVALTGEEPSRTQSTAASVSPEVARAQSLAALNSTDTPTSHVTATPNAIEATSPSKIAMPESGLKRSGSTRLPHSPRAGGPVIPSRTTSSRRTEGHSRMASSVAGSVTSRTIAEERIPYSKPKAPSHANQASEDAAASSLSRSSSTKHSRPTSQIFGQQTLSQPSVMSRGRPSSMIQPSAPRPAFSTYQQHYSPAKSVLPKPALPSTKSTKSPPAVEEDIAVSLDLSKQQIELLQLSLLHQASHQSTRDYTTSAKRKLSKKHTRLRKDYETLRATELVHQRIANLSALESWCRDPGMLVENLQILSLVYSDITSLIDDGSKYGDIVSIFELWLNEAEAPEPGMFIQSLPEEWKMAHASLALKLRSIQRNLGVLPPPSSGGGGISEEGSGLEVVLRGCKALVDGMLKELEVMVKLEKELLARERTKIEEDVQRLVLGDVGMREVWAPAWQKVV